MAKLSRHEKRERRHKRIRKKVFGTPERPRLCLFVFLDVAREFFFLPLV